MSVPDVIDIGLHAYWCSQAVDDQACDCKTVMKRPSIGSCKLRRKVQVRKGMEIDFKNTLPDLNITSLKVREIDHVHKWHGKCGKKVGVVCGDRTYILMFSTAHWAKLFAEVFQWIVKMANLIIPAKHIRENQRFSIAEMLEPCLLRQHQFGSVKVVTFYETYLFKPHQHKILESAVIYLAQVVPDLERVIVVTKRPGEAHESISESKHKQELRQVRDRLKKEVPKITFEWGYAKFNMHDRLIRLGNGWTVICGRGNDIFVDGKKKQIFDASEQYLCNDTHITYNWNEAHVSDGRLGIGALQKEGIVR